MLQQRLAAVLKPLFFTFTQVKFNPVSNWHYVTLVLLSASATTRSSVFAIIASAVFVLLLLISDNIMSADGFNYFLIESHIGIHERCNKCHQTATLGVCKCFHRWRALQLCGLSHSRCALRAACCRHMPFRMCTHYSYSICRYFMQTFAHCL